MAQRGGAVQSHMRLSSEAIWSDLIPKGEADMILSVEPLEALRYFEYLRPDGIVVTSSTPYRNIPDYPDIDKVLGGRPEGAAAASSSTRRSSPRRPGRPRPRTSSCSARPRRS